MEKGIIHKLKEIVRSDPKVYYILWKFAPNLLTDKYNSFEDFKSHYKCYESKVYTLDYCNTWLLDKNVQKAIKYVININSQAKLFDLITVLYEKGMTGDVGSIKAYAELVDKYFAGSDTNSELASILTSANVGDEDEL